MYIDFFFKFQPTTNAIDLYTLQTSGHFLLSRQSCIEYCLYLFHSSNFDDRGIVLAHIEIDNLAVNRNIASISHINAFYYDSENRSVLHCRAFDCGFAWWSMSLALSFLFERVINSKTVQNNTNDMTQTS